MDGKGHKKLPMPARTSEGVKEGTNTKQSHGTHKGKQVTNPHERDRNSKQDDEDRDDQKTGAAQRAL